MFRKHEIRCPKCNNFIGYSEDFMWMVIYEDVKCLNCGTIVIYANRIEMRV